MCSLYRNLNVSSFVLLCTILLEKLHAVGVPHSNGAHGFVDAPVTGQDQAIVALLNPWNTVKFDIRDNKSSKIVPRLATVGWVMT
jgi:hypothetical protein